MLQTHDELLDALLDRIHLARHHEREVVTQQATLAGRRVDIELRLVDGARVLHVIWLELKEWAREQPEQLADYARDLALRYAGRSTFGRTRAAWPPPARCRAFDCSSGDRTLVGRGCHRMRSGRHGGVWVRLASRAGRCCVFAEDSEDDIRTAPSREVEVLNTPIGEHPVSPIDLLCTPAEMRRQVVSPDDHRYQGIQLIVMLDRFCTANELRRTMYRSRPGRDLTVPPICVRKQDVP
jgi:hypothetical protein